MSENWRQYARCSFKRNHCHLHPRTRWRRSCSKRPGNQPRQHLGAGFVVGRMFGGLAQRVGHEGQLRLRLLTAKRFPALKKSNIPWIRQGIFSSRVPLEKKRRTKLESRPPRLPPTRPTAPAKYPSPLPLSIVRQLKQHLTTRRPALPAPLWPTPWPCLAALAQGLGNCGMEAAVAERQALVQR